MGNGSRGKKYSICRGGNNILTIKSNFATLSAITRQWCREFAGLVITSYSRENKQSWLINLSFMGYRLV